MESIYDKDLHDAPAKVIEVEDPIMEFDDSALFNWMADRKTINAVQSAKARFARQSSPKTDYVTLLKNLGSVHEDELAEDISKFLSGEFAFSTEAYKLSKEMYEVSVPDALNAEVFLVNDNDGELYCLTTNPFRKEAKEILSLWGQKLGFGIAVCTPTEMQRFLKLSHGFIDNLLGVGEKIKTSDEISVKLEKILTDGREQRASDIRMFIKGDKGVITFRIDGDIFVYETMDSDTLTRLSKAIEEHPNTKVSDTNRMVPRTGITRVTLDGQEMELRCNFIMTLAGVDTNLRFLQKENYNIYSLGASIARINTLKRVVSRDRGLVLFTGPTGCGKSTTMYSLIELLKDTQTICTVEDPVEHRMDGIVQIDVNPAVSFETGIAAILRHDPDTIVIGEVRTEAVARATIMASNTGHLTFSSLHTTSAVSAIARLRDLGISPVDISDNLFCVVAQKLVKRVCTHCKTLKTLSRQFIIDELNLEPSVADELLTEQTYEISSGEGCEICSGRSTYGRCLVSEILLVTDEVKEMIESNTSVVDMTHTTMGKSLSPYLVELIYHLKEGTVSLEEAKVALDLI